MTINTETVAELSVRVGPPGAVAVANAVGIDVPGLINLVMLAYLSVLLAHKLWTIFKDWREGRMRVIPPQASDACKRTDVSEEQT